MHSHTPVCGSYHRTYPPAMALAASLSLPMAARLSAVASSARRVSASVARLPKPPPSRAALSFARRDRGARLRDVSQRASDGDGASDDDAPRRATGCPPPSQKSSNVGGARRRAAAAAAKSGRRGATSGAPPAAATISATLPGSPRTTAREASRRSSCGAAVRYRTKAWRASPRARGSFSSSDLSHSSPSARSSPSSLSCSSARMCSWEMISIHGGDAYGGAPAYVPPEVLLAEPTVDRMVPMYDPTPYGQ